MNGEILLWLAVIACAGGAGLFLLAVALLGAVAALAPSDLIDLREKNRP